jgi:hypothetical protein
MRVTVRDDHGRVLGHAARILDFTNGSEPPLILFPLEVRGRLRFGHTASIADPSQPILIDAADDRYHPDAARLVDARCHSCNGSKSQILRDDTETVLLLEHMPGCKFLAMLLAKAGQR